MRRKLSLLTHFPFTRGFTNTCARCLRAALLDFRRDDASEARARIDPNTDQKWPHSRLDSHWSTVLCSGSYRHIPGGNRDRGRRIFREDWR